MGGEFVCELHENDRISGVQSDPGKLSSKGTPVVLTAETEMVNYPKEELQSGAASQVIVQIV